MKLKENCSCTNTQLVKKGFNGSYAVRGIIASVLVSTIIISITLSAEQPSYFLQYPKDYTFVNSIVLIVCVIICSIGVFAGTIQMNTIYRICRDCGDKITFIHAD